MARPFDPLKILKQITNAQLGEFFRRRGQLTDVPFLALSEDKIEPVFEALRTMRDENQKIEILSIFHDIHEATSHQGMAALVEGINKRCPQRLNEFTARDSAADKVMWVYLNEPAVFEEAFLFAQADTLAAGRYWSKRSGLPKWGIVVDQAMCDNLAAALTDFYPRKQARGHHCKVEHHTRSSDAGTSDYFFAYLDDYADKHLEFDDADKLTIRSSRQAFSNIFAYNGHDGTLDMYATGGQAVQNNLQGVFCKAVLNVDILNGSQLLLNFYHLDHLYDPNFRLITDPRDGIAEARITQMRIAGADSDVSLEIKVNPESQRDIHREISRSLNPELFPAERTRVLQATFRLRFNRDHWGKESTMTFDVSVPNYSDLKGKPDKQRAVGERCLRLWQVVQDDQ